MTGLEPKGRRVRNARPDLIEVNPLAGGSVPLAAGAEGQPQAVDGMLKSPKVSRAHRSGELSGWDIL